MHCAHGCTTAEIVRLSLTSLQAQVRAGNLQELVYKQGQAGVTKATVSITFHNDDPATGPAGYEDKERITVTRTVSLRSKIDHWGTSIGQSLQA
jgi:chromosome segregation ATPase